MESAPLSASLGPFYSWSPMEADYRKSSFQVREIVLRLRTLCRSVAFLFFSSRRRHTRCSRDWSSDVCSSDLPAILKMCGSQMLNRPVVQALFQEKFSKRPDRRHFLRGILWMENGMLMVRTTGSQGSGILTSMVKANGLIDVPVEVEKLKPGDVVNVQVLGGGF